MGSYYTYILYSEKLDKFYIGYSSDLKDRLIKHERSLKGFTARGKPWKLVYYEIFQEEVSAREREKQLKGWKSSIRIKELISRSKTSE